ncbi:MAG: hypothetical protein K8R54_02490 [Bacteroidales bacterium]|nr:hypothetical protein [Bacteroidales bacterium]
MGKAIIKSYLTGLMPNHFHLMVLINSEELPVDSEAFANREGFGRKTEQTVKKPKASLGAKPSEKKRTINNSIGIMLRSYTDAVNREQNRSGALFRRKTKAECINCSNGITPSFIIDTMIQSHRINVAIPEKQYPQICFNYIHNNPVKAKFVKFAIDWEFSSAVDYFGNRKGKLVNKDVADEYIKI